MSATKIIDLSYLIESSLNDEEYIRMMIEMYVRNSPEYLSQLSTLYKKNELNELKRVAHKFKASISIMGIHKAAELIKTLEHHIEDSNKHHLIKQLIDAITNIVEESIYQLKKILLSKKSLITVLKEYGD